MDVVRSKCSVLIIVISKVAVFTISWVKMEVAVGGYDLGS